ncbi:MAG: VPLPA-CTERM sorting domain-containing protein [Pseudomonadota bacterium]
MKKILVALGLTLATMSAHSALVFNPGAGTTESTNQFNDILGLGAGQTFSYGFLSADVGDVITFTNLITNVEAGFRNLFINGSEVLSNKAGNGSSFSYTVTEAGNLDFKFVSQGGFEDLNGSRNIAVIGGLFGNDFVLLLDDSFVTHRDFDDHAVGVNDAVSAVPVPAALPLMASALGAFGIARRRNKAKAV